MSSTCIHAGVQCRYREQKRFVEIKPVPVVNTWKFDNSFHQGSVGTHVRCGGQYIHHFVGNLFRCHCAKTYGNRLTFDSKYYCKNIKGAVFGTQCSSVVCSLYIDIEFGRIKISNGIILRIAHHYFACANLGRQTLVHMPRNTDA